MKPISILTILFVLLSQFALAETTGSQIDLDKRNSAYNKIAPAAGINVKAEDACVSLDGSKTSKVTVTFKALKAGESGVITFGQMTAGLVQPNPGTFKLTDSQNNAVEGLQTYVVGPNSPTSIPFTLQGLTAGTKNHLMFKATIVVTSDGGTASDEDTSESTISDCFETVEYCYINALNSYFGTKDKKCYPVSYDSSKSQLKFKVKFVKSVSDGAHFVVQFGNQPATAAQLDGDSNLCVKIPEHKDKLPKTKLKITLYHSEGTEGESEEICYYLCPTGDKPSSSLDSSTVEDKEVCSEGEGCDSSRTGSIVCMISGASTGSLQLSEPLSLLPNEPGLASGRLMLYRTFIGKDQPVTAKDLYFASVFTMGILNESVPGAVNSLNPVSNYEVSIRQASGFYVEFVVKTGESIGYPKGQSVHSNARIELLDANGNTTTDLALATHIKHYREGGSIIIYSRETSEPVKFTTRQGRVTNLPDGRLDIIRVDDAIRQVKTEAGLLDVKVLSKDEFEVRHYLPWQVGAKLQDGSVQIYGVLGTPQRTVNIKRISEKRVRITRTFGTRREVKESVMRQRSNGISWETNRIEDGKIIHSERRINMKPSLGSPEAGDRREIFYGNETGFSVSPKSSWPGGILSNESRVLRTHEVPGEEKPLISSTYIEFYRAPWGGQTPTRSLVYETSDRSEDPIERIFEYYIDEDQRGSYGKLRRQTMSNGQEITYTYDEVGHLASTTKAYLDDPVGKVISYDYTPLVSADSAALDDFRPRTITVTCDGIVVQKTFFAAYVEPSTGEYTEISEIANGQSATFGDAANLRTTTIYYASSAGFARAGRLKKTISVDGVVSKVDYIAGSQQAKLTVIATGNLKSDETPLAGYSVRSTRVTDSRGALQSSTSSAYAIDRTNSDQATWSELVRHEQSYNTHGYPVKTEEIDAQSNRRRVLEECTWINGQKRIVVDELGVKTFLDIDDLYRVKQIRRGAIAASGAYEAQEEIVTSLTGTSMMNGSSVGWMDSSVEVQAGGITLTSSQKRDYRGRVNYSIDENGYESSAVYNRTGTIADVTAPNTATVHSERFLDGRMKSESGSALVDCFYQFGIEANGSTTVKKSVLTANNARYVKCLTNMLGQTVSCTKPSYNGALVTSTTRYEVGTGRPLGSSSTAANTPNSAVIYNSIGVPVRTGISIDNNTLTLASSDRIVDVEQGIEKDASGIWAFSKTYIYPTKDNATRKLIGSSRSKASNFSSFDIAAMESTDIANNTSSARGTLNRGTGITQIFSNTPGVASQGIATSRYGRLETTATPGEAGLALVDYDSLGRATRSKEPRKSNWATVQFKSNSTLLHSSTNANGDTSVFNYFGNGEIGAGRVSQLTLPDNTKQFSTFTLLGNVESQRGSQMNSRYYLYDDYNQLSKLYTWKDEPTISTPLADQLASASATTWNYEDATGLLLNKRYADGKGPDNTYDTAGRPLTKMAAREVAPGMRLTTTHSYTAWGEHQTTNYNDSITKGVKSIYDRIGRMTHSVQGLVAGQQTRVTTASYDLNTLLQTTQRVQDGIFINDLAANYLTGGSVSFDKTMKTEYDSLLRSSHLKVAQGNDYGLEYIYGTEGRLSQIKDQLTNKTFGYDYHPNARNLITELTAPVHKVVNAYEDNRNILKSKTNQWRGNQNGNEGEHVSRIEYTVNSIGQRTKAILSGKAIQNNGRANTTITWDWQYSIRGKLTNADATSDNGVAAISRSFNHDAIGNRTSQTTELGSTTYLSNALNQYSSITNIPATTAQTTVTPQIDEDGNVTDNGTHLYVFDAEDRLIEVREKGTNTLIVSYRYDAYSKRIERSVPNGETRQFLHNGWNVVAEYKLVTGNWELVTTNTWGLDVSGSEQGAGGIGGLLATNDLSAGVQSFYPLYDGNGNITEYVDDNQAIVAHYEYGPFGKVLHSSGSKAGDFRYQFSTKPLDTITGLHYYGYRWYDASQGRWINRDPIKEDGGLNVYDFCGGDPINKADYLGLDDIRNTGVFNEGLGWRYRYHQEGFCGRDIDDWQIGWRTQGSGADDMMIFNERMQKLTGYERVPYHVVEYFENWDNLEDFAAAIKDAADSGKLPGKLETRIWGAVKVVGATFEMVGATALAAAPEPTMVTKVGACALGTHAIDMGSTGLKQIWTGHHEQTMTFQVVKASAQGLGASEKTANLIATGVDMAPSVVSAGVLTNASRAGTIGNVTFNGTKSSKEMVTVYRGVNVNHHSYAAQATGVVKPNNQWWQIWKGRGSSTYEHNAAHCGTLNSSYTSWTTDIRVAQNFALRPGNTPGMVIKARVPASKVVTSPNTKEVGLIQGGGVVSESEVLLRGTVRGTPTPIAR